MYACTAIIQSTYVKMAKDKERKGGKEEKIELRSTRLTVQKSKNSVFRKFERVSVTTYKLLV